MIRLIVPMETDPAANPKNLVQPELSAVESLLYHEVGCSREFIAKMCSHLLESGGKRFRPLLVLLSGRCFQPPDKELIAVAAAAELIHMASLAHDDVIDQSENRRGKATLNHLWDNRTAVLSGDFLFAKAFALLAASKHFPILSIMVNAIQDMCEGEVEQALQIFNPNQSEQHYLQRTEKKTAKLIAACCQAGAIIGQAQPPLISALGDYGLNLGLTFQIADDILDYTGDPDSLGKPIYQDLASGNYTLPILFLLKDKKERQWLTQVMAKGQLTSTSTEQISTVLKNSGAIDYCYAKAYECRDRAKAALQVVPDSLYREMLLQLADLAVTRIN
ncbi:MAG: polyprenyl synthetase family protein [Carboxydocellales bacterium]